MIGYIQLWSPYTERMVCASSSSQTIMSRPHVHVFGDGQVKINLIGPDGGAPSLVWAQGMKGGNDVRRAVQIVQDQQEAFLARWREIHG